MEKTESKPVIWFQSTVFQDTGSKSPPSIINFIFPQLHSTLLRCSGWAKKMRNLLGQDRSWRNLLQGELYSDGGLSFSRGCMLKTNLIFLNDHCPTSRSPMPSRQTWIDHVITIQATKCRRQRTTLYVKEMQVINTISGKPFYMLELHFP